MSAAWQTVLDRVRVWDERAKSEGHALWFRGHACSCSQLRSTLHRAVRGGADRSNGPLTAHEFSELLLESEKTLLAKFRIYGWPLLHESQRVGWPLFFAARHYGLPTRVLDWTWTFACALYFALDEAPCDRHPKERLPASLFLLVPERLNDNTVRRAGIVSLPDSFDAATTANIRRWYPGVVRDPTVELPAVAIAPPFSNGRMAAQDSAFVLTGDSFEPQETLWEQYDCVEKVLLPVECRDDALEFLRLSGARSDRYFPELEHIVKRVRAESQL